MDTLKVHNFGQPNLCNDVIYLNVYKVSYMRYLDLIIDKNVCWSTHVNNIVSRLCILTYRFYKLRSFLLVKRIIYFALYQTIFQYGLLVWGPRYKCNISAFNTAKTNHKDLPKIHKS